MPGGRTLITAPGQTGTFTNATNGRSITLGITGTFLTREGSDVVVAHGRSVLAVAGVGVELIVGNFTFVSGEDGDVIQSGRGRTVEVCPLIA